jgi:murein L,D-transpeptidase YafK
MSSAVLAIFRYLLFATSFIQPEVARDQLTLSQIVNSGNIDPKTLSISIDKSDYQLAILSGEKAIKTYPVVFGGNPTDDKLMQGDQCTPEGNFKIRGFYPHAKWSKFIWIDYPNDQSWSKHNEARQNGKIPENAKIGGEIGIHGVPEGYDYAIERKMNWTLGCISMTNEDVNEIYPYVFEGMTVQISK